MKNIILVCFMLITTNAFAMTDYQCVNDCTAQGYLYTYCTKKCSYNDGSNNLYKQKQVDYKCVNDCTRQGYQYQYCTNICSY